MRSLLIGACAIAVTITAACEDNRSTTLEPVGALGFGTNFAKTSSNLPRGTVTFPAAIVASANPDSVIVTLAGLDSLATGTYTLWFANDSATKYARVTTMNLTITRVDTTINSAGDPAFTTTVTPRAGVSGFKLGGSNIAIRVATSRSAAASILATDSLNVVLLSIETAATPGASPAESKPLWARRSQATALVSGIRFGDFARGIPAAGFAGSPAANQEYVIATSSTAGVATMTIVPRGRVEVRAKIMIANDSNYFRPPVGYYYNAYAVKLDTTGRANDTLYIGRRTSPYPKRISLFDVDKVNPDPDAVFDTPRVIYAMATRVSADSMPKANGAPRPWYNFGFVRVNIQSKYSQEGRMGPATVLEATLPASVRGR